MPMCLHGITLKVIVPLVHISDIPIKNVGNTVKELGGKSSQLIFAVLPTSSGFTLPSLLFPILQCVS